MDDLLKVLSNRTNQSLLAHLQAEPSYARRAAGILDLPDAEVTRRLRQMEQLGLVTSEWSYIGKNVKLYRLNTSAVSIRFDAGGLQISLEEQAAPRTSEPAWRPKIPEPDAIVGREKELASLQEAPVTLVEGLPGIGKTGLVATYVRTLPQGTVFWHDFRGIESLNWLVHRAALFLADHGERALLDAIEGGQDLMDRRDLLLEAIRDERFTWVFDDVHWVEDQVVKTFLTDAVNGTRAGRLILISRHAIPHDPSRGPAKRLTLQGLDDTAAKLLLAADGEAIHGELLVKLHEVLGGHPLALHLSAAAAHESGRRLQEIVDSLPDGDLEDYLLREVHAGLSEASRRLLSVASVFRTSWELADLQAVAPRVREAELMTLRRHHLVEKTSAGFVLHEIIRTFFYRLVHDAGPLHRKVAQYYLEQHSTETRIEAMHHFLAAEDRKQVLELLEQNIDLHEFDFVDAGYQRLYLRLLDLFTEDEVADPRRWALMEDERGDVRFYQRDFTNALQHYDRAYDYFREHSDGHEDEDLAWKRALALRELGRSDEARVACAEALGQTRETGLVRERLEQLQAELATT